MSEIRLSILIASTPSRWEMTKTLVDELELMIEGLDIEILVFLDNKKRSIGEKREALKNIANGKYFMFLDSDDTLMDVLPIYNATKYDVDVIDFKVECRNEDGSIYIVTQRLGNEIEHNTKYGIYLNCKRPPWFMCAWRTDKFKKFQFPPISYSEDYEFLKHCWLDAKTEKYINKVLYKYNFNLSITEASTESNEHWTNPNHE